MAARSQRRDKTRARARVHLYLLPLLPNINYLLTTDNERALSEQQINAVSARRPTGLQVKEHERERKINSTRYFTRLHVRNQVITGTSLHTNAFAS